FGGSGVQAVMDQRSRTPDSLARSFATSLRVVCHPKIGMVIDAMLIVSPEHARVFAQAGWSKAQLRNALNALLTTPGTDMVRGANGIAEGMPAQYANQPIPKFREGGLHIVHAGGTAGLFSAIIGGWPASGSMGSTAVTVPIKEES
ncbi:MAG: thioredoxin, partial [Chloroflexi bacterium]|nr:thioredoxin [Chloroflexota bacterium]